MGSGSGLRMNGSAGSGSALMLGMFGMCIPGICSELMFGMRTAGIWMSRRRLADLAIFGMCISGMGMFMCTDRIGSELMLGMRTAGMFGIDICTGQRCCAGVIQRSRM
jgi:hypothetical protein